MASRRSRGAPSATGGPPTDSANAGADRNPTATPRRARQASTANKSRLSGGSCSTARSSAAGAPHPVTAAWLASSAPISAGTSSGHGRITSPSSGTDCHRGRENAASAGRNATRGVSTASRSPSATTGSARNRSGSRPASAASSPRRLSTTTRCRPAATPTIASSRFSTSHSADAPASTINVPSGSPALIAVPAPPPKSSKIVVPAKAGTQLSGTALAEAWTPAFAGVTM